MTMTAKSSWSIRIAEREWGFTTRRSEGPRRGVEAGNPEFIVPRGYVTLLECGELCQSQMHFNMTANSCTWMFLLSNTPR